MRTDIPLVTSLFLIALAGCSLKSTEPADPAPACTVDASSLIEASTPSDDASLDVGSSSSDAGFDAGRDACTSFGCPSHAHWIEGTFAADTYVVPVGNAPGPLAPMKGVTWQLLSSFDYGATFKDPLANGYQTRVLLSDVTTLLASDADVTPLRNVVGVTGGNGELDLRFGTAINAFPSLPMQLELTCDGPTGLSVGGDQYVVPGPWDCAQGTFALYVGGGGSTPPRETLTGHARWHWE